MKRTVLAFLSLLLAALPVCAQFYNMGTDPGGLEWSQMRTDHYRLVYPAGMDSLARTYAISLEKWRPLVAASSGFTPNQFYRRPMPVVLHPWTVVSNGSVAWSPRIMDLLCTPDATAPMPIVWEDQLVSHESRHVAQMQLGKTFPIFTALTGQLWAGAAAAVYGGPAFLEGDAVVAETELSGSGRGRTASFLEYQRVCFDAGDWRDYWKWLYGSQKLYTPDHYTLGYITEAGVRSISGSPDYTRNFYAGIRKARGLSFNNLQRSVKDRSEEKFKPAFRKVQEQFQSMWNANDSLRAPFTPSEAVSPSSRLFSSYRGLMPAGDVIYAVRSGLDRTSELVKIDSDGKVARVCPVNASAGKLAWSPAYGRIFWTEVRQDLRWSLRSWSELNYLDSLGRRHVLTRESRFFNPASSMDGELLCVTEYPAEGGSAIVVLSAWDGHEVSRHPSAPGVQYVEAVWGRDGCIYASAITSEGAGIYALDGFRPVLGPQNVTIKNLFSHDGSVFFTSDRDGTDQLYGVSPATGRVTRLTSARYGAEDFCFPGDGRYLYYTSLSRDARRVCRTAVSGLDSTEVDYACIWHDPIADSLSRQVSGIAVEPAGTAVGEPEGYSKLAHLFRFHSWAPVYVNYDEISELSGETLLTSAGLGATAFFQNDLGSFYGYAAASAWTPGEGFTPGAHAAVSWNGWYPVIKASADITGRSRRAALQAYVPLNLSSGGWSRGVVPQLSWSTEKELDMLKAGARAYVLKTVPSSCIFPRWGAGVELGAMQNTRNGITAGYGQVYAYAPGFLRTHGIRVSSYCAARRGFSQSQTSFSYALPFAAVDWSFLSPVAFIRNFELYANAVWNTQTDKADEYGFGAQLNVVLGNLLWIPYDTRIGVSVMYYPGIGLGSGAVMSIDL